jgi:hypothetical protein
MLSNQARAVVDVIEALEAAKVPKDEARKAAMSLADYVDELHRGSAEHFAKTFDERFKHLNALFDERFDAINSRIDERFKVNEERIKTMFWKGALFLTGVILLANPAALSTISKILRLS